MFGMFKQKVIVRMAVFTLLLTMAAWVLPTGSQNASAAASLKNPETTGETVTWDCVWFGHYLQTSNGSGGFNNDPIKWRVLSVDGNEALLLADKNLDCKLYNEGDGDMIWETSTVRSWLNGSGSDSFLGKAFTGSEQNAVCEKTVQNPDNPYFGTAGGNATRDKVFFLSIDEATNPAYGFPDDNSLYSKTRRAVNTDYAKHRGARTDTSNEYAGNGWWWLRSPGSSTNIAASVLSNGLVILGGDIVGDAGHAVRPALFLNISSDAYSYAGTVSSDGKVNELGQTTKPPAEPTAPKPEAPQKQTITAKSITKIYGSKPFSLGAKAKTRLTYKSGNVNVAVVNGSGRVTLKSPGKAVITITAAATADYKAAMKKITVTVKPKQANVTRLTSRKKGNLTAIWTKDAKATGYQVMLARNAKFTRGKKVVTVGKNRTVKTTVKKLKAKKTYYVKVRSYKSVGKTKLYGAYSKAKKIRVK